jgi:hypothetical protein
MRRKTRWLIAVPLAAGAVTLGTATSASAQSSNAGCVAQLVLGPFGPPGETQRQLHVPRFGEGVSFFAQLPHDDCLEV